MNKILSPKRLRDSKDNKLSATEIRNIVRNLNFYINCINDSRYDYDRKYIKSCIDACKTAIHKNNLHVHFDDITKEYYCDEYLDYLASKDDFYKDENGQVDYA